MEPLVKQLMIPVAAFATIGVLPWALTHAEALSWFAYFGASAFFIVSFMAVASSEEPLRYLPLVAAVQMMIGVMVPSLAILAIMGSITALPFVYLIDDEDDDDDEEDHE